MRKYATRFLTRSDIARLMSLDDYLLAAEEAFAGMATGRIGAPPPMHLAGSGGGFHVKGASSAGDSRHVAVKLNGNFPDNPLKRNLPTIQGVIVLADATDGSMLVIMDSMEVTLQRTAAATALAARHLARADASTLAICGCGAQAVVQLRALANVFPLRRVKLWDRDFERARRFAKDFGGDPAIEIHAASDLDQVARDSDLIVTCTTATSPFLGPDCVSEGTFIAAVGADSPAKSEIMPALMANSVIVTDVLEQCVVMGDLHHAVLAGRRARDERYAELGEVVVGKRKPRANDSDIVVFDSTGTAAQDLTAALRIHQRASAANIGVEISLGE
ncbi:MAG TPA: ornithine cyclodeaminase family protein [Rhizomicrobium sp.]|nr:ornithine cyclodeaminase family protein [Rhizomicrobium sp.]